MARYANSLAGQVDVLFLGMGVLVAAVSWFQMRLEDRERLEKLELDELAKTHGGSALFEAKDAEVFPAQRSREQFERFFVPAFTVLLFLLQAGGAWLLWRWLSRSTTVAEVKQPITGLGAVWRVLRCCCSCWAASPPPLRGWNGTVCCGPAPATCS